MLVRDKLGGPAVRHPETSQGGGLRPSPYVDPWLASFLLSPEAAGYGSMWEHTTILNLEEVVNLES